MDEVYIVVDSAPEAVFIEVAPLGDPGADGEGVPTGGTTGQVLKKASNANYDTVWANESGAVGINTYIQDTDPAPAGVSYAWWQTSGGNIVTLWLNVV